MRLQAVHFYEVIVNEGEAQFNCRFEEVEKELPFVIFSKLFQKTRTIRTFLLLFFSKYSAFIVTRRYSISIDE